MSTFRGHSLQETLPSCYCMQHKPSRRIFVCKNIKFQFRSPQVTGYEAHVQNYNKSSNVIVSSLHHPSIHPSEQPGERERKGERITKIKLKFPQISHTLSTPSSLTSSPPTFLRTVTFLRTELLPCLAAPYYLPALSSRTLPK